MSSNSTIDVIKHAIETGHTVSFKRDGNNISIRLTKKATKPNGIDYINVTTQFIQMDKIHEENLNFCIGFMLSKINEK